MKRCTIPGKKVHLLADFYDQIQVGLKLPAHFGRNLDALWDSMTSDVEGPLEIVWEDSAASEKAMGPDYARVVDVLKKAAEQRDDLSLHLR